MALTSKPVKISVIEKPTMPNWAANAMPNVWVQISGTNLSALPTFNFTGPFVGGVPGNPARKVDCWCSMAFDPDRSRLYQAAGGGHRDYAGNEVEMLDLSVNKPAWVRLRDATLTVQDGDYYTEGTNRVPTSRHHNFGIHYNPIDNRIMLICGARFSSGMNLTTMDSFNLSDNTYNPPATHPNLTVGGELYYKPMCVNPTMGDIYVFANAAKWTRATNTWNSLNINVGIDRGACPVWDTTRNIIVMINGMRMVTYNPSTESAAVTTLTGANIPQYYSDSGGDVHGNSTVYVPSFDAYLHYVGESGGTVYSIKNGVVSNLNTTGGNSIPSNSKGSWGRFRYAPNLQGIVYAPIYDGNVWFLKIKEA